jgi:aconitate hydratase
MPDKRDFTARIEAAGKTYTAYSLRLIQERGLANTGRLPYSIRVLAENVLRKLDGRVVREEDLLAILNWQKTYAAPPEIPFRPARVLMQDFTGVPAVVDLAAMRDAMARAGGDPAAVNPLVPVELVVDHSVQIDFHGSDAALSKNVDMEYKRNRERYALLKWAQKSFQNFAVVPPNSGICHQVNLEHLGRVVMASRSGGELLAFPDTLVGTDSHTTMINGLGVVGFGVGGIEAEAVMLGQPYYMTVPEVIGLRLEGVLPARCTATDLVLALTQLLRKRGVTEKFVEFHGPGVTALGVAERATVANMAPEYGATVGFFPVDQRTADYLAATGRREQAELVARTCRETGLWLDPEQEPEYTEVLVFDLGSVEPSVAGPARPQDRVPLAKLHSSFAETLEGGHKRDTGSRGRVHDESAATSVRQDARVPAQARAVEIEIHGQPCRIGDGSVVIASITSCTNTSNPALLIGAGLLAKNAVARGLKVPPYVKTSFAPGSKTVALYLARAGLTPYLEALGFHVAAHGCATCIGNSGPLHPEIERVVKEQGLTVAAVLSGNRNFEARIHQTIRANYLASPLLVVAFALRGRVDLDISEGPVGLDPNGEPVFLKDIWPAPEEIKALAEKVVTPDLFASEYAAVFSGDRFWQELAVAESPAFAWEEDSTYIKNPPYFEGFTQNPAPPGDIREARVLAVLGDSVTTDHISPAGAIPKNYPAGHYLVSKGVAPEDFNSYGARRGNHEVMIRGSFANIRLKNKLAGKEGSWTVRFPEGVEETIYAASMAYQEQGVPLLVLGGKEYGAGSSRDWAAKGTRLLGVRMVIARSFERIHRSNLVGMGVLPAVFKEGGSVESLGLTGREEFSVTGIEGMFPRKDLTVRAVAEDGKETVFTVAARLDTEVDVENFINGGILPCVLRKMLKKG